MTTPTGRKRVFLAAFRPPSGYDEMTDAQRHSWALTVADAVIAAYRRSTQADGTQNPDADQPVPGAAPTAGVDPADDGEPE